MSADNQGRYYSSGYRLSERGDMAYKSPEIYSGVRIGILSRPDQIIGTPGVVWDNIKSQGKVLGKIDLPDFGFPQWQQFLDMVSGMKREHDLVFMGSWGRTFLDIYTEDGGRGYFNSPDAIGLGIYPKRFPARGVVSDIDICVDDDVFEKTLTTFNCSTYCSRSTQCLRLCRISSGGGIPDIELWNYPSDINQFAAKVVTETHIPSKGVVSWISSDQRLRMVNVYPDSSCSWNSGSFFLNSPDSILESLSSLTPERFGPGRKITHAIGVLEMNSEGISDCELLVKQGGAINPILDTLKDGLSSLYTDGPIPTAVAMAIVDRFRKATSNNVVYGRSPYMDYACVYRDMTHHYGSVGLTRLIKKAAEADTRFPKPLELELLDRES